MSRFRAYIRPFDSQGNLTEYQEVTEDVDFKSMGKISQKLDNDRFNVGLLRFSTFNLKLRNETGKYSGVETIQSIFRFRRGGSQFKVTWQVSDENTQCGIAVCGASKISPEIEVFVGVLNDESTTLNIVDQRIQFRVFTVDSIFPSIETPFSSLSNGDLYSEALLTILNQTAITQYMTVDVANISVGLDIAMDTVADFENTTVKEALDRLLFQSNSVLYVTDNVLFIKSRDGGATSQFTFRGQASNEGVEDVIALSEVSTGLNSVFNFWTWADTTLVSSDATSIQENGIKKKEIAFDELTGGSKQQQVLDAQRDEFSTKKQQFQLTTSLSYETLELGILDQVRVDYPTVYSPASIGDELPIYGLAIYGEAKYPIGEFSITIDQATPFKITSINIDTKKQTVTFKLEEQ